MLKTSITDLSNKKTVQVDSTEGEVRGLVVATRPLKTFEFKTVFLTNDTYGEDINQDASAGGTPEQVHNGIDDVLWTASAIVGVKYTFNSTDVAKAGSNSIKTNNPNVNNIMQIAKGSNLTVSGYVSLSMWVYVASDWGVGDSINIYGWDTGTGLQVGTSVNLEDYFNSGVFGVWHKITIPLSDMGLISGTIDALRIQNIAKTGAKSPVFYLDVIQFEQTGAPIRYEVKPDIGTWFHVTSIKRVFADVYDGTVTDGTMPGLSYDKILGETLDVGYVYQRIKNGNIDFSVTTQSLSDILHLPNTRLESVIDDGTNVFIAIQTNLETPLILKSEDLDHLRLTIQEDLSGFLLMRIAVSGYEENRS